MNRGYVLKTVKRSNGIRVTVQFQKNAWCDEGVMVTWIQNDWSSYFCNPPMSGSDGKLLNADIHRGKKTPTVKNYFKKCRAIGLTGYVQVLDMVENKPFKAYAQRLSEKHMKVENYVGGKISASETCILMTKWCGEAWESISRSSVVKGFKK